MTVFVDTSAILAVLDSSDECHDSAAEEFRSLLDGKEALETSSYVLVESHALVQARLGMEAVQTLVRDLVALFTVVWIDGDLHRAAVSAVLAANRRRLSLVDCASFEVMTRRGLRTAFTLDRHFEEQGFEVVPR